MPDGRICADGHLTRAGVFVYRNPDGTERREYRPPDEVFRQDSLGTFALAPITDDHPPTMLTADTAKDYMVGVVGENIRRDGDHVAASLMVFDAKTIKKMESGKIELSCGYECDLVTTPGKLTTGERYDAIQTNIRGNHVALVSVGRAGSARVRMDSLPQAAVMVQSAALRQEEKSMPGTDDTALKSAADEVAKAQARADAAETEAKELKARIDAAEGEAKGLRDRLDAIQQELKDQEDPVALKNTIQALTDKVKTLETDRRRFDAEAPNVLREAVKRRLKVESAAAAVLDHHLVMDSLTDRELMMAVVEKLQGSIDSDRSDEYVYARFDAAIEGFERGQTALASLRKVAQRADADQAQVGTVASARDAMIERNRNAWKPKTA